MKMTIESVDNGYVVSAENYCFVYQEGGPENHIQEMLLDLLDLIGESGGRHDKERIYIDIRPGDKYDG